MLHLIDLLLHWTENVCMDCFFILVNKTQLYFSTGNIYITTAVDFGGLENEKESACVGV